MSGRTGALGAALLALAGACAPSTGDRGGTISVHEWTRDAAHHGGYSGIEVAPGGTDFLALTDQGHLVPGRLRRGADGAIAAVAEAAPVALRGAGGAPIAAPWADSEGLARDGAGRLCVSFEQRARVLCYDSPSGIGIALPRHPDFAALPDNKALEGLAADRAGRLWALAETPGPDGYRSWILRDGRWRRRPAIPTDGAYSAVGLDIDDEGRIYLLERALRGIFGFQSRLRRLTPRDGTLVVETLMVSATGQFDNLEGVSVWRDTAGRLRATMIADDNFLFFQTTEIVELALER